MDSVLRAAAVYFVLLVVFRIAGRRSLGQITTFDFVLLLIVSEAVQNAMIGDDMSLTNGLLVVATLVVLDIGLSLWKRHSRLLDRLIDSVPTVILADGKPIARRLARARVDEEDILEAARAVHGIGRLDEIHYAVLERDGSISVIPRSDFEILRTRTSRPS